MPKLVLMLNQKLMLVFESMLMLNQMLQLVQMLVVQLELLHVPPPPIGAAISIGAVGRACC